MNVGEQIAIQDMLFDIKCVAYIQDTETRVSMIEEKINEIIKNMELWRNFI